MDRKEAGNYQVEDFVTDESFINYVFRLDLNDQTYWEAWLNAHPGHRSIATEAAQMLEIISLKLPPNEVENELNKLRQKIEQPSPEFSTSMPSFNLSHHSIDKIYNKKRKLNKWALYLPLVIVACFSGYFLYCHFHTDDAGFARKFNNSAVPIVFTLTDSTVVTLAPQSNLRYPNKFTEPLRKVYLEGEAQFHVKRDVSHPFKVYSGDLVATVLGTVFKIRQQPGDSIMQVELLTGKLKVETTSNDGASTIQSILLDPEERVLYNRLDKKLTKETWQENVDAVSNINHLKFQKENFDSVARQLKTVFGITLINESNKKNWLFTGEFNNSSAVEIVENICIVKKLHYEIQRDTIYIK